MYIIIVYDINTKRVNKVKSLLRMYLNWIQNSVFEGEIKPTQFKELKIKITEIINKDEDSVILYKMPPTYKPEKTIIGIEKSPIKNIL